MWPFKKKRDYDAQTVSADKLSFTQADITERFDDDVSLTSDEWIVTTPLNSKLADPRSNGLPAITASDNEVYRIASEMSLFREAIPTLTVNDGVYCPICHIANVDRARLRTPCPKCGRNLLQFGWD